MHKKKILVLIISILMTTCQSPQKPSSPTGWEKIEAGVSEAQCAHGDPYVFWIRRGTSKKLIIFFQGGGFCWNDENCKPDPDCSVDDNSYSDFADCESHNPELMKGIFDFNRTDNPFLDYSFVVIPYCTADFHWGNNIGSYSYQNESYTIHHQGFVNAQVALEWTYSEFPHPKRILVAGSSAGSFGSILHTYYVMNNYSFRDTKISQLGDSGAIFPPDLDFDINWGALPNFPKCIADEGYSVSSPNFDLARFYIAMANCFPGNTFALLNYDRDLKQLGTYNIIEEQLSDDFTFSDQFIIQNLENISENGPDNLKHFTTKGNAHVILSADSFFLIEDSNGQKLSAWVYKLAEGKNAPNIDP